MDNYNSICITQAAASIASVMGIAPDEKMASPIEIIAQLQKEKLNGANADRVVLYNPDAIAMWLFQKYTNLFAKAICCSDIMLPMLSVMPSVTPVCFASMYTGGKPDFHGIKSYVKPILSVNTIFDTMINTGKKVALVSTANDSMSVIFLKRAMEYFIYETVAEVNKKALELIERDEHDIIVIYNPNYDSTMHKTGTESDEALRQLEENIDFYAQVTDKIKECWPMHNTFYGFMPDHGCHDIDGGCGSHGLDMPEDMNIIHFYGFNKKAAEHGR